MSGRFPGAAGIEEFWRNLREGVESVSFFSSDELKSVGIAPSLLANPDYVRAKAILDDVDQFDARFFGFTPSEAEITDPQHRIFLECAWEALERAGYDSHRYPGLIGIYAGAGVNTYLLRNLSSSQSALLDSMSAFQTSIHNKTDHLTTRAAYLMNLRGPGVTVQTACSTSLVAVCLASQSLLNYQCDMALAGGVTITLPQKSGYLYQAGGIGSRDGHCRTFDATANGTVDGNGIGIVVLKRLTEALVDGDHIHAVIKGMAINNDGSQKAGYTAPAVEAQAEVIAIAQAMAGFAPDSVEYVEAHGTATVLGDPIEIAALTKAFRLGTDRKTFCALGSVKTNIGHLDAAAGVAGLIKTVLALEHQVIPPSLHFERPNPRIDLDNTPFYVNSKLIEWKRGNQPRRAGVSSFGIGGTNAHVVLEESLDVPSTESTKPWRLLLLSAKTSAALEAASDNLAGFLEKNVDTNLADVAYTLQIGRSVFNHRRAVLCRNREDAVQSLRSLDYQRVASRFQEAIHRPVTFMFPGQGTQYVNMGAELYRSEATFRGHIDDCSEMLAPDLGVDLRELLYASPDKEGEAVHRRRLDETSFTQPALFVTEYALAKLWMEWGVVPAAMIGHSIGEYVAATLSGVMSLADALALVAFRGQLIQQLPAGSMLAVTMTEREVLNLLSGDLSLGAVNGSSLCVVSGPTEAIDDLEKRLSREGQMTRRLHTSHAFHSGMVEPIAGEFTDRVKQAALAPPRIPYISNVTGRWISASEATDPAYWARHLCQTVRFGDGITELLKEPEMIFLEVGPGRTLKSATRWNPSKSPSQIVETSLPHRDEQKSDFAFLLSTVGKLWLAGVNIDWPRFYAHETRRRVPLPTYPFERRSFWVDDRSAANEQLVDAMVGQRPTLDNWFYVPHWKQSAAPQFTDSRLRDQRKSWLLFCDDDGLGDALARRLRELDQAVTTVSGAADFHKAADRTYTINPSKREDYVELLRGLQSVHEFPDAIVHLWNAGRDSPAPSSENTQRLGFFSILRLTQAIGEQARTAGLQITLVSTSMHALTGEESLRPEKATMLGPCLVIPREYPQIQTRSLDLVLPEPGGWQEQRLIDQLITEASGETAGSIVAYRGGRRWVRDFERTQLNNGGGEVALLRKRGVYLITGGLGGIGLALAEYLAREVQAKLVLCGRSDFPGKQDWDQWLATHSAEDKTSKRILALNQLEQHGAEVIVARTDVTNEAQMRALVTQVGVTFGGINGIIHAAGIAGGGLMQLRTPEDAARVLAPKVEGTQVIGAVCDDLDLDFFFLCSSLGALIGWPGQIDYSAANAFMDAFADAHYRRTGTFTTSINWGEWQALGMAGTTSLNLHQDVSETKRLDHPLLERYVRKASGEEIYFTEFNVGKQWVLDEHRLLGNAVIPGVAYFEMVRSALGARGANKVIELHEVYFVGPLRVRDDQTREVRLVLQPIAEGYSFTIESESEDEENGAGRMRTYALGKVRLSEAVPVKTYDLAKLAEACGSRVEVFAEEDREDDLGPRWQNVRKAFIGTSEVLTILELPKEFASDFEQMRYHPALMDRAVGRPKEYLVADEYLPVSYKSLKIHGPIPPRIYSYARYQGGGDERKETLTWDTVVLDDSGSLLVEIEGFVQKRISDAAGTIKSYAGSREPGDPLTSSRASDRPGHGAAAPEIIATGSMSTAEGVEAFHRILAHQIAPQVAVSPRDLNATIAQAGTIAQNRIQEDNRASLPSRPTHPRPNLSSDYVAPRNESERRIAAVWQETLGIDSLGVHDNFLELGGDSVQAILIIAALNKTGLQLTPQQFFQYQTIAELSALVLPDAERSYQPTDVSGELESPQFTGFVPSENDRAEPRVPFSLAELDQDQFSKLSQLIAAADEEPEGDQSLASLKRPDPQPGDKGIDLPAGAFDQNLGTHNAEVEEIEALLRLHPAVQEVAVVAQDSEHSGRRDSSDLIAYVVADETNGHRRPMEFSLFYFADDDQGSSRDKYHLYLEGGKFADRHGFKAIWTPERHFHSAGGLYPNPSVLSAALATVTQNVRLCAGSVVLPLHHPLRIAEEWAVVDNLSQGRVAISFTSGWIPNDFVFFPDHFPDKRDRMFDGIETIRRLWRGDSVRLKDGAGTDVDVKIFPRPIQPELPIWLTCSGDPQMFVKAGELGVNVLTALLTQSVEETAAKIVLYREALARSGHDPGGGRVTLMVHTFVGDNDEDVLKQVRGPLCDYLRSHVGLVGTMVKSLKLDAGISEDKHLDDLISFAFERYYQTASLIGTPSRCAALIDRLSAIGVDEVACFVDFGVKAEAVISNLQHLNDLKDLSLKRFTGPTTGENTQALPRLLSNFVSERLSSGLVPVVFLTDKLPRKSDGTIDRKHLALHGASRLKP
jgi:natural product biosynthesis luciferase-like monooxygenase protein